MLFGILTVFELATFSRPPRPAGGLSRSRRCLDRDQRDIAIVRVLASLLPDHILLDERHVSVLEALPLSSTTLSRERVTDLCTVTERSLLRDPSVSQMMDAIGSGGDVYTVGSERVGDIVCFPFECSLSQLSALRPSAISTGHRSANALGDDVTQTYRQYIAPDSIYKTDQGQGFTPFAMGLTLAYIDNRTPEDSVTALTVAYHSGDRTYPRLRTSDSLDSSTSSRVSAYPLHIQIPDIGSGIPTAPVVSGEYDSSSMRGVGEEKGLNLGRGQAHDNDSAALSAVHGVAAGTAVDAGYRGHGEEKLDISSAEGGRSEGGLLCFVTEGISFHLSQLFVSARETVHLKMGWSVLQRDSLIPLRVLKGAICNIGDEGLMGAETSDAVTKGGDIDVISYFTRQRNAWVKSEEVKRLLLYLIEHTPAVPLNCLNGLQSALLVIAHTLSKYSDTSGAPTSPLSRGAAEHLRVTGQGVSGASQGEELLDRLLSNLSTAFQNRCRCFIIRNEGITSTSGEDTEVQPKSARGEYSGEGRGSVLHILVCLQPLLHCFGKVENFAVHICVPSLPDRSPCAISTRCSSNGDAFVQKIDINRSAKVKSKSRARKCVEKMPFIHLIEGSTGTNTASPVDTTNVTTDPNSMKEESERLIDSLEERKELLITQVANVILYTMSSVL